MVNVLCIYSKLGTECSPKEDQQPILREEVEIAVAVLKGEVCRR